MLHSTCDRSPRERQVDALIAEFELAAEQSRSIDPEQFLQQHAEFAPELREYLDDVGRLRAEIGRHAPKVSATIETIALQFRDYRVLHKLGAGGMGTVYLALQIHLEKTVALKILKADRERDSSSIARFKGEMRAVGKLEHPHIVRALAAGDEGGTHFLVMEFLEGCDLARLLKNKGRLEVPLACELIRQAALGLQHAHDHKLVHRDVKPSNLMLSTTGQVKVLDLGLAQLQATAGEADDMTRSGEIVGTWRYMAPEQFLNGRQVDSRSDVYSLGVTLYSLLAGELPLRPGEPATHLPPIATLRPDVPPDLQVLLSKMLAPQPAERIQTMTEVASALQSYEMQGAASIAAIKTRLNLPPESYTSANDPTQSPSGTADGAEVIPPPIQPPSIPPQAIAAPPRAVRATDGRAKLGAPWITRAASLAGIIAVLSVAILGVIILCNSIAKNRERNQAAARSKDLCGITKRALERRDLPAADVCLLELSTLSHKFPNLVDAETLNGFQKTIRLQNRATESQLAVQEALADRKMPLLIERLHAYLAEPYATETDQAQSLLADAERFIQLEPATAALVARWTDTELAEYLRSRKMPQPIVFANETLQSIYDTKVQQVATNENARRQLEKPTVAPAPAPAPAARPKEEDEERRQADAERARRAIQAQQDESEAKADWQRHPERHGVLGLIPQDAIGGVGVASVDQVIKKMDDTLLEIRAENEKQWQLSSIGKVLVEYVLNTAPFECYRQDKPLAIVFANPAKAGVELRVDNINPLLAMWDRETLERIGVVVGTPVGDLRKVEKSLNLATRTLVQGRILHSRLPHLNEVKQVSILLRDGRLYVGFTDKSVRAVADGLREQASVAMDMSPREATRLTSMELLLHFAPGTWREEWHAMSEQMRANLATDEGDQEAEELANEFATIMRRAKTFLLGVKLDQGVHTSLVVLLSRHEDARLVHFQQLIGHGDEPLTLAGLPHDGATGVFATRGNGVSNAVIAQSLLLPLNGQLSVSGVSLSKENRITLSKAFREVWNEVAGTRAGNYGTTAPLVVLDTYDPEKFMNRLQGLVRVWDDVSLQLAGGDELKASYRFAITETAFDDRKAYQLSLTNRKPDGDLNEQLLIVPVGKQMVISWGGDQAPLRQVIKNLNEAVPRAGLAEHPAILAASQRLPATRKMELYLWVSQLNRQISGGAELDLPAAAEYSAASLTLGETSIGLDVWVPLREIIKLIPVQP